MQHISRERELHKANRFVQPSKNDDDVNNKKMLKSKSLKSEEKKKKTLFVNKSSTGIQF